MITRPTEALAAPLLERVLAGATLSPPPVWLMRQAGRYLPEYREVRARAGTFLDLCYDPKLAAEVTLQPITRFGFDAAILFSDILVVPHALGQEVGFTDGEGPRLAPIACEADLGQLDPSKASGRFERVYETVARVRSALPRETALIGFCGAPWTVATYMVAGRGSPDQAAARLWAYRDPAGFARLIDLLIESSAEYLAGQVASGAQVLQIFDSWAGSLPDAELDRWVIQPTADLLARLRSRGITAPVIGFPRGIGQRAAGYLARTGVDAIGCDSAMSRATMLDLARSTAVQGNLDPLVLVAGGERLDGEVRSLLAAMAGRRHIFNLGHGIVPETPLEHVARLIALIRGERS